MRRIGALALLVVVASLANFAVGADGDTRIEWHEQVMEAWKKAQADKRPLLVYVAMDGCVYCRKMERDTLQDPQIAKWIERGFVAAKLNGPKDPVMLKRLKVAVYPTTVIISPDNKVLDSIAGYASVDELSPRLESITVTHENSLASAARQSATDQATAK